MNVHHLSQAEEILFTTDKMKNIIGNDGCSSGVDEILMETFKPPPNLLTPPQVKYFHNLQLKNKIRPTDASETINMQDIKDGYKSGKKKQVPHHQTDTSVTISHC